MFHLYINAKYFSHTNLDRNNIFIIMLGHTRIFCPTQNFSFFVMHVRIKFTIYFKRQHLFKYKCIPHFPYYSIFICHII